LNKQKLTLREKLSLNSKDGLDNQYLIFYDIIDY